MEISRELLAPAATLALWTLVMLFWMIVVRFPALKTVNIDLKTAPPGGRGQDLEKVLPPKANWAGHNYMHLVEQPTIFYATVIILALLGEGTGLNVALAWIYVGLRIVHSIWQATVNTLSVRFPLFLLASLALVGLAINAVRAAFA